MSKILVIDDEPAIRANLVATLELENWEIIDAPNGLVGIDLARKYHPDLILCDIMMPEMDGYRVLLTLRGETTTSLIPVMFLSAKSDRTAVRYGIEIGADDYLTKPFTPKELIAAVKARLERQKLIETKYEQRLDSLYTNVVYTLPHELRTPLTAILGLAELIAMDGETMDGSEIVDVAQTIYRSGKRLERLVENILLYAQLEMIQKDAVRLAAIRANHSDRPGAIIKTVAMQQAKNAQRESDLSLDVVETESVQITQDNLEKIVLELVDNAFKFSPSGTPVRITTSISDSYYFLTVNDKGLGMTPDQIAMIGAYMQFERKLHEQQGTGLGLAIVKLLAELHDGELTIECSPQRVTIAKVTLDIP
jgi:signal transduction histidine kinase